MKNCTIIISHYESLPFLHTCIRQIRKYKHPEIAQHIIIADQSGETTRSVIDAEYGGNNDITVVKMKPLYSGYGIDYIMRFIDIKTEYICQLHVDAFPIHKNWLYLCLELIEKNGYSFVGQLHFETRPDQRFYYYLKNMFFSMSPTFNVGKTNIYKEMALEGGFTRLNERKKITVPMTWKNNDFELWANQDPTNRGSDDDVIAFCWEDNYREHNKLGLSVTNIMGLPPESGYGRIIDDIVFHFGFCRESIGVMNAMGENYRKWTERINKNYDDNLIDEMLGDARKNQLPAEQRSMWDGKIKKSTYSSEELNKTINDLKNS